MGQFSVQYFVLTGTFRCNVFCYFLFTFPSIIKSLHRTHLNFCTIICIVFPYVMICATCQTICLLKCTYLVAELVLDVTPELWLKLDV